MKGTQPHEVGAAFFEMHITTDDFDNIGAVNQFLDKRLGNGHHAIFLYASPLPVARSAIREMSGASAVIWAGVHLHLSEEPCHDQHF